MATSTPSSTPGRHAGVRFHARNEQGRDLVVGDIHGFFVELQQCLDALGFDERNDRLFAMGDLVDRGPDCERVLDWLAKPWFFASRGNHEAMLLDAHRDGRTQTREFHCRYGGAWFHALPDESRSSIAEALAVLPLAMEVETTQGTVALIHADFPYDEWGLIHQATFSTRDETHAVWSIDRYQHRYEAPIDGVRAMVHGHITIEQAEVLGNVHYIDTHGERVGEGRFTFLELERLEHLTPMGKPLKRGWGRHR